MQMIVHRLIVPHLQLSDGFIYHGQDSYLEFVLSLSKIVTRALIL